MKVGIPAPCCTTPTSRLTPDLSACRPGRWRRPMPSAAPCAKPWRASRPPSSKWFPISPRTTRPTSSTSQGSASIVTEEAMAKATTVERQRRQFVPNEAWLAKQAHEPILEPDLPIVDPHHHLWDHANHRYLL